MGGEKGEEGEEVFKNWVSEEIGSWFERKKMAQPIASGTGREDKGGRWAQKNGPAEA